MARARHIHLLTTLLAGAWLFTACNSTKWVPPGERLLVRNTIEVPSGTLDPDELASIVKQKPNKRVLGRPLYLDLYNLRDPERVIRKRARQDSLCSLKNAERKAKGRKEKVCDKSLKGRNGEAPVLLDTNLTGRTLEQFRLYGFKEGYFETQVSDTVYLTRRRWPLGGRGKPYKKPKVAVAYTVEPGRPWVLCTVDLRADDPLMRANLREVWSECLLKPGDRFDADVMEAERTRITSYLRHLGHLYFTSDMILFDADTSAGDHEVDLIISLERPVNQGARGLRGTAPGTVYTIHNVVVDMARRTKANAQLPYDTLQYEGFTLLYKGRKPEFRPRPLTSAILVKPSARFNQRDADRTYRRLTNLRVFDRVDIAYDTTGLPMGLANAKVALWPNKRQSVAIEGLGTNRGGFLGTSVNFNYRHNNLFRTMTSLQASMGFGFEAQQRLTSNTDAEGTSTAIGRDALFNTLEFGPEVKLTTPLRIGAQKAGGGRFVVNGLYNYQRRPDYTRILSKGAVGIEVKPEFTLSWGVYIEQNNVRIPQRSVAFIDFLNNTSDPILRDSYTDHVIINLPKFTITFNNAAVEKKRHAIFVRGSFELAGHLLRPFHRLSGRTAFIDPVTGDEYYTVNGVRYADYARVDGDFRYYYTIHDRSSIAMRFAPGWAKPLLNQTVMPFETSFFSGGANGMRAWRARSLGPGSYRSEVNNFDRIGEFRLEGNVEYRFKVFGYLEGALFADAGNIWFLQDNPAKPGGELKSDLFLGEIAVGTGLGARLNFDFFLVRFDLGLQTKDPSLPIGQRWIFQEKDPELETRFGQKLNFNLGIGYPF